MFHIRFGSTNLWQTSKLSFKQPCNLINVRYHIAIECLHVTVIAIFSLTKPTTHCIILTRLL